MYCCEGPSGSECRRFVGETGVTTPVPVPEVEPGELSLLGLPLARVASDVAAGAEVGPGPVLPLRAGLI
jgi:hypothetical protein